MSATALAERCGWKGHTKVSKIEHGQRAPTVADIKAWCAACGQEEQIPALLAALRDVQGAYLEWARLHRGGMRQLQEWRVPLYERTRRFRVYHHHGIPGLVQTPTYAEQTMRIVTAFRETGNRDIPEAVAARMKRQHVLHDGDRTFAFLLEEQALRSGLGGPEVMAEQFDHLLAVSRLPRVSLGIIPTGNMMREFWPTESFWMFDDAQVSVEATTALITVTSPSEIALYSKAFTMLSEMAVVGDKARAILEATRDRLT